MDYGPAGPNVPVRRSDPLQPSRSGSLSYADLLRVDYSPLEIGRVIADSQGGPDMTGLIASILKNQKKNNAAFLPVPYIYTTYDEQQILTENPRRSYLLIQNVSAGDLYVVFEGASTTVQDFSADTNALISKQSRAIRIVGGGYYEPITPPTNPVTLFTLNAAANGVVLEGS